MKKIHLLFPLIILLLLSACRKDEEILGTTTMTPDPPIIENFNPEIKPVTSSVDGKVQDMDQRAIENATVRLGNLTTTTNKYGLFSFENVSMNEKGTFITVTQNQYMDGSRRFFPKEGINNKVVIEMIAEDFQSSFDATTGGTVIINGTTGVNFPANSIVNANGEAHQGEVFISHAYLDPTANSTANRMPGNLQGVQTDLEEVSLQSFGMINLSLQDVNGAPLNIGEGFTATITVALPDAIAANAPDEIPLWSFNDEFGIWVEEGSAEKINGHYVGEVKHFSWWNCDAPFPLVELDVTLTDENGNPVSNHIVALDFGGSSSANCYSYTNGDGFTSGKVPAEETLLLEIRGFCGEVVYSELIGPFSDNVSLGTIAIDDSEINNTEITGTLVACDGANLTNGGVIVQIGNLEYTAYVDNGSFDFFISTCPGASDLSVIGLDFSELLESDPFEGTVGAVVNTGDIAVCDIPITESFLLLNIDSETYSYEGSGLTGTADTVINISYFSQDSLGLETEIFMTIFGDTVGSYDDDDNNVFSMFDSSVPFDLRATQGNNVLTFSSFNITEVSPNLIGNFEGTAIDIAAGSTTVNVSGSFYIIQ